MFQGMQGERSGELAGPDVWQTCRELIPAGSVFAFLAEHRDGLFPAGMFADMYPSPNGRPSMPPQVLAMVVVLQALHGPPDPRTGWSGKTSTAPPTAPGHSHNSPGPGYAGPRRPSIPNLNKDTKIFRGLLERCAEPGERETDCP